MIKSPKGFFSSLPEVGFFLIILFVHSQRLFGDFWSDEIYSLNEFILVPISKTLTDYHVPNNHVFANLIANIYLKIIQIDSLGDLLYRPYLIRVVPFVFALGTYFYLYKIGRKFFSRSVALLSVGLLVFNLSYINFALQIRGYGLSAMLLIAIVYCIFEGFESKKSYVRLALLTSLLFYTTPSNLLFLLGIGLYLTCRFLIARKNKKQASIYPLLTFCVGIFFGLIFYAAIIEDVFFNKYTQRGESFRLPILIYYSYAIVKSLLWSKWVLVPFALVGAYFIKKNKSKETAQIILLIIICLVAAMIPFLLGIRAPIRVCSVLLPVTSLLLAITLDAFWTYVIKINTAYLVLGVLIYSMINLVYWNHYSRERIADENSKNLRSQDIYYQYYSYHYQPLREIVGFTKLYDCQISVIVYGCEPYGVTYYLDAENIPYSVLQHQELLCSPETKQPFYLITAGDKKIDGFRQRKINKDRSYHSIYLIEQIK